MSIHLKSKEEVNELIIKFLSGQSTAKESIVLHEWVALSDENKKHFVQYSNIWNASARLINSDTIKTKKALELVTLRINSSGSSENKLTNNSSAFSVISRYSGYLRIAALWFLLISIGAAVSWFIAEPSGSVAQSSVVTVISPMGSKALTFLPDGTKVWLNAGSKIEYTIPGRKDEREVLLTGEACFDVAKDKDHPFIVDAGGILIKVFGTRFNIKAYPEERVVETTLIEGSVSVTMKNNSDNTVLLNPNEQAFYYKATEARSENILVTRGIDPTRFTLWINDRLQITGETLESLAVMLERKYDVKINFRDPSLKELRFTGFIENETIEQILEMIRISSSVDYKMDEREIWLINKD